MNPTDLVLRLSCLAFLVFPIGQPFVRSATIVLALAGVLHARTLRSPWLWIALFTLAGYRVAVLWPMADNHAYLLAYLCLAIGLSRWSPDPGKTLEISSRWLVAGVFAFAIVWKLVLSDDFTSGVFYRVLLLADQRFESLTGLAGVDPATLSAARDHFATGLLGASLPEAARRVDPLAQALTIGALAIELALAIAFVWPSTDHVARVRGVLLTIFCAATYAIAPVAGFGWILLCLGLAQLPASARRVRGGMLACFGVLVVYDQFQPLV